MREVPAQLLSPLLTRLLFRLAERVDSAVGWSRLPRPLGLAVLMGLRGQLRRLNLHDTGRGRGDRPQDHGIDTPFARTVDGTGNDHTDPLMGSTGSRFGRNVPVGLTFPEAPQQLLEPSPRLVSTRLLTRDEFKPATTLNLLAAAWIQFEVHDWFSHRTADTQPWHIALDSTDPWPRPPMTLPRTEPDPSPDPTGPPTFVTHDTHWWDGSQIYGDTTDFAHGMRTGTLGQLRIDELGLQPATLDPLLDPKGTTANFWVGLALLHSLFMREHNAICRELARSYPGMTDQQLYDTARLVNTALMAKIHTIDWTPAVIAHPTTRLAMRANWFGVLGERFDRRFGRITDNEVLQGIPGSPTDHHGVAYSLTEEFVAVYRMHPLIPDDFTVRGLRDDEVLARHRLTDLTVPKVRDRLAENEMDDLFYSFGVAHPGEITLHNFPGLLQNPEVHHADSGADGPHPIDLAAADILRTRERGVLRYNAFRRAFRLRPVASFEELTDNPVWAEELRQVYGDVEQVDVMVGMYAEPKPKGFAFSDTAFRVFILMASRRLQSDRFLTTDFRPHVYTQAGMDWVHANSMHTVLLRHFPALEPTLRHVENPFAPWPRTPALDRTAISPPPTTGRRYPPAPGPAPTFVPYSDALERPDGDEDGRIDRIVGVLHGNNERALRTTGHALRDAHAKSHAVLRGELTVYPDLSPQLSQGLFAAAGVYPVITRLSSTAGLIRSDQIRGVHGMAVKVLGVHGERCLAGDEATTQDLLLVTHREFPFGDTRAYLTRGMPLAWLLARLSDRTLGRVIDILSAGVRARIPLPNAVKVFIEPNTHILGMQFHSAAPIRWGDYVAKFSVVPLSPAVAALEGLPLAADAGPDAYRNMVRAFFASQSADYEIRVQLCTDVVSMPIEDATAAWPESTSPYVGVAKLSYPVQDPCTDARRTYGDEALSFNSWRGLNAHRPLGPINRLKFKVYEASSDFRHDKNGVARREPADPAELPE
jgi:Animal haem peroxidase